DSKPCEKYRQFLHSNHQERSIMIEKLVDVAAEIIDSIWYPLKDGKVVTTRNFVQEILKRSKATYLTLQLSLFYLFRVKGRVHERLQSHHAKKDRTQDIILCGRRMFLASLMVASKYLQDKNYRNKAWAKIAGLDIAEINAAEMAFLGLIDYKLFISKPTFDRWYTLIHGLVQK
ncbi:cyclin-domain-containing protein, partial [Dichotomocladium elegans]